MIARQADLAPVVLLVDDEPLLLAMMARSLREQGFAVLAAPDGAAALRQLEALGRPADLLVTDLQMPGLTGDLLAGAALSRGLAHRVLFVSGFARDRESLEQLGPVLPKPFCLAAFRETVGSLLHSSHVDPSIPGTGGAVPRAGDPAH